MNLIVKCYQGFCIEPFRGSKYIALIEPFLLRLQVRKRTTKVTYHFP